MKIYILGFVLFLFSTIYSFCWIDKNLLRISDTSFMFAKIAFIVSAGMTIFMLVHIICI